MLGCCCCCKEVRRSSTLGQQRHRLASLKPEQPTQPMRWLAARSAAHDSTCIWTCMRLLAATAAAAPNTVLPTASAPCILSVGVRCRGPHCGAAHITDWAAATAASLVMPNSL